MFRQQPKNLTVQRVILTVLALSIFLAAMSFAQEQKWKLARLPIEGTVTGISFPSPRIGYIATSGGGYGISRDAGANWIAYTLQGAPPLEDIYFKSVDTGLMVGRNGAIYRTIDGAQQWEDRSLKDTAVWLTSAVFLNDTIALAAGFLPDPPHVGRLYRSIDGGRHWDSISVQGTGFGELFYTKGVPVCFQSNGKLNYSQDLGKTWKSLETLNGKPGRATAVFGKTGIICGSSGMLAISSDRGATWTLMEVDLPTNFTSVVLADENTGFLAGTRGVLMVTTDAGKTWTRDEEMAKAADLADLTVAGDMLFAVGAAGHIYSRPLK